MRPAASGAGTQSKGAKGKLRILCLPGWRTSKTIMEIQMDIAGLRKTCNSMATFIAVNPSYEAQPDPPDAIKALDPQGPYYQWWYIDEARSNYECVYQGMNGTIDNIADELRVRGPYDGILGFSQGSGVATILAALQADGDKRFVGRFRFVILVCGFQPRDKSIQQLFQKVTQIKIPSLHVYGTADPMYASCRHCVSLYKRPITLEHSRGHSFPRFDGEALVKMQSFLQSQMSAPAEPSRL
eukprot:GHVT01032687.1.p1 GENE.GHVT01032687.1~~GHVT01032687.1.p1  ORF type:complete len:241 (-),score=15.37 GHVT01032687.1:1103-1825(-)